MLWCNTVDLDLCQFQTKSDKNTKYIYSNTREKLTVGCPIQHTQTWGRMCSRIRHPVGVKCHRKNVNSSATPCTPPLLYFLMWEETPPFTLLPVREKLCLWPQRAASGQTQICVKEQSERERVCSRWHTHLSVFSVPASSSDVLRSPRLCPVDMRLVLQTISGF